MKKPIEGAAKDYQRRQVRVLILSMLAALIGLCIVYALT